MKSFEFLVDSFLLQNTRAGLIALTAAVAAIIIAAVILTAKELKARRKDANAEQSADDNGGMPDTDGNN